MTDKVITAEFAHIVLTHPSPEVISHLESATKDVKIDTSTSSPTTVQCETCGVSKATELISRKTDNEEMIREPGAM